MSTLTLNHDFVPQTSTRAVSRRRMGMSCQSDGKFSETSWPRVVAFLRRKYPSKTADCVAADTGIKADTVRKMLADYSTPTWANTYRLIRAYRAALLAAAFLDDPQEWIKAAARDEEHRATVKELERVKLKLRALEGH